MKFTVQGVELEASKVNVGSLTKELQEIIRGDLLKDGMDVADMLTGKERDRFLMNLWRELPKGFALLQKCEEWLQSFDGVKYILKKAVGKDIELTIDTIGEYMPVVEYALDLNNKPKEDEEDISLKQEAV